MLKFLIHSLIGVTFLSTSIGYSNAPKKQLSIPFLNEKEIIANVNGKDISFGELNGTEALHRQIEESIVENYRRMLESQILTDLLSKESSKNKVSPEVYIKRKEEKVKVSKLDIEEAKKLYPNLNSEKVTAAALAKKRKDVIQKYYDDLLKKNDFQFYISSKGFEVKTNDKTPSLGSKNAKNVIHLFSDFQCPYCRTAANKVKELKKNHASKILLYFHHLPLNFHPLAHGAATASQCAHEQNKFWEFHDKLFEDQSKLNSEALNKTAQDLKLDMLKFKSCLESPATRDLIQSSLAEATRLGVNGTPTFFLNGKKKPGSFELTELR